MKTKMEARSILPPKKENPPTDLWNRAAFRAAGLQGRRDSSLVDQKVEIVHGLDERALTKWQGRKRGGFAGPGGVSRLWFPHMASKHVLLKKLNKARGAYYNEVRRAKREEQQG